MTAATSDPHPSFAALVRARRVARGMTQADVARSSGVHRVAIAQIEGGRGAPSLATAVRLAKALGLTLRLSDVPTT